jgi:hypothetical protein
MSEYKSLKYWEKFGVWAGLATIVSFVLTLYMLLPSSPPTGQNVPSSPVEPDGNNHNVTVKTHGDGSPAIVVGRDVIVNSNDDAPVYFLNAGNPPEPIVLFEKPVYSLMDSASNRVMEPSHGTIIAVIAKRSEPLNLNDLEDIGFNGLRIVDWTKVRLKIDGETPVVGWVFSRFVDVR